MALRSLAAGAAALLAPSACASAASGSDGADARRSRGEFVCFADDVGVEGFGCDGCHSYATPRIAALGGAARRERRRAAAQR